MSPVSNPAIATSFAEPALRVKIAEVHEKQMLNVGEESEAGSQESGAFMKNKRKTRGRIRDTGYRIPGEEGSVFIKNKCCAVTRYSVLGTRYSVLGPRSYPE